MHAEDAARAATGAIVLIEGPAGIGKTPTAGRDPRAAARTSGTTTLLAARASSSASSRSASCASCSRRRWPTRRLRERALGGAAAPAQAVFASLERGVRERRLDRRLVRGPARPVLDDAEPGVGAAAGAGGRRPPVGRPLVAALPDLPGAAARGAARCSSPRRVRTGEPPTDEAHAGRPEPGPRDGLRPARPAQPARRGGAGARAARRGRRGRVLRGRARDDRRQPAARAPAPDGARGRARRAARRERAGRARDRAARGVAQRAAAAGPHVRARRSRSPARSRCSARTPSCPPVAALAELDDTEAATAIATLARAEILRPEAPLGFVHPLVRDAVYHELPPGERELQHARAARILADGGRRPGQVATHLLGMPRRGDAWAVDVLREAARSATAAARPTTRSPTSSARSTSRRRRSSAPRCCSSSGWPSR